MPPKPISFMEGAIMFQSTIRVGGVLAALLISTAAQAQITAEQVWQNWRDASTTYGQTMTAASEARQGDTLVISGLQVSSTFEGGGFTSKIDTVNFRELGDGTVEVTMSPEYPLSFNVADDKGKVAADVLVRQPELKVIASGTPEATTYAFTAPSVKLTLEKLLVDDAPKDVTAQADLSTLAGTYVVTTGDKKGVTTTFTAGDASVDIDAKEAEAGNTFKLKGKVSNLSGKSDGMLLSSEAMGDLNAALKDGFNTKGNFAYGVGSYDFEFADPTSNGKGSATIGGGDIHYVLDSTSLGYGGTVKDVAMKLSSSDMPFPELAIGYSEGALDLLMPPTKSDTPGDFKFLVSLKDLTISDDAWNLVDPNKVLPRDPATVAVDATGTGRWLTDILNETTSEQPPAVENPIEMQTFNLNNLVLKLAGAAITGTGALTFDNTDLTTFQGMPAPTGKIDLKLTGLNGLIDKLIQLGFVPQDQAMGARMMLGLFAKPAEGGGPDDLVSTLEFKDKGFYANGQRLQ